MTMIFPAGCQAWPDDAEDLEPTKVVEMYQNGFAGAFKDPEIAEAVEEEMQERFGSSYDADDLLHSLNFADAGKGKLTLLHPAVVECYGFDAWSGGPAQKTGDCVSKAGRDASLVTVCVDALSGTPDEVTGKVEAVPEVSETAKKNAVFCNEGIYLNRGHNGQGMSCDQGLRWVMTEGGIVVRKKYDNVDLESYNVSFEQRGSAGPPPWLNSEGKLHQIRGATKPTSWEMARDLIAANKAPIWNCSSLGFSSTRDANGFSKRSGSWSHSWIIAGFDDRPWTYEVYGHPLALYSHRWGIWNTGPRDVRDSASYVPADRKELWTRLGLVNPATGNIIIPNGTMWIDARLLNGNWMRAISMAGGWPAKSLPGFNLAFG